MGNLMGAAGLSAGRQIGEKIIELLRGITAEQKRTNELLEKLMEFERAADPRTRRIVDGWDAPPLDLDPNRPIGHVYPTPDPREVARQQHLRDAEQRADSPMPSMDISDRWYPR